MENNRHAVSKVSSSETQGAGIGYSVKQEEQAKVAGVYTVTCRGPVEELRPLYVNLVAEISQMEEQLKRRRKFFGIFGETLFSLRLKNRLATRKGLLAEIPMEDKWEDSLFDFPNLVTTVGKNDLLDKYLAGSAYTAAWYIGLISATSYTTGPAVADTMASHGGWAEDQNYSQGSRPTTAWSAASGGSKALSAALAFSMNAATTIKGCFLVSNSTKGGTTGILYSAGLFTGGDKTVGNGDTLNVSYTASV